MLGQDVTHGCCRAMWKAARNHHIMLSLESPALTTVIEGDIEGRKSSGGHCLKYMFIEEVTSTR